MIWPANLVSVTLMNAMYEKEVKPDTTVIGGKIPRYRWFAYVAIGAFVYVGYPGSHLFPRYSSMFRESVDTSLEKCLSAPESLLCTTRTPQVKLTSCSLPVLHSWIPRSVPEHLRFRYLDCSQQCRGQSTVWRYERAVFASHYLRLDTDFRIHRFTSDPAVVFYCQHVDRCLCILHCWCLSIALRRSLELKVPAHE